MSRFSFMKFLIVDDMDHFRADLKKILMEEGVKHIYEASNGEQAYLKLKKVGDIDIVLCDINMPIASGIDFTRTVRSDSAQSSIPIIIVSTENEKDIIIDALAAGATDYIIKPYTKDIVLRKVDQVVKS